MVVNDSSVVVSEHLVGKHTVQLAPIQFGRGAGEIRDDNELGMKLVRCPAGAFPMGDDRISVTLTRAFWIGQTPVTQAQYRAIMEGSDRSADPSHFKGDDRPVERVIWIEANEFCQRLTAKERKAGRLPKGAMYRLPRDAEWEYACRAGVTTKYCFGDNESELPDYAWCIENAEKQTHPVSSRKPNNWGLYDMHGNVLEWCQDWCEYQLQGGIDPSGPESGSSRVLRGGSWGNFARNCRCALRSSSHPAIRGIDVGFRVLCEL